MEDTIYVAAVLMLDCVGTGIPGIMFMTLAVISVVCLKCAPPRVDGFGGFDTVAQEEIEDERIGVENSDEEQHVESLGKITSMIPAEV